MRELHVWHVEWSQYFNGAVLLPNTHTMCWRSDAYEKSRIPLGRIVAYSTWYCFDLAFPRWLASERSHRNSHDSKQTFLSENFFDERIRFRAIRFSVPQIRSIGSNQSMGELIQTRKTANTEIECETFEDVEEQSMWHRNGILATPEAFPSIHLIMHLLSRVCHFHSPRPQITESILSERITDDDVAN